METHRTKPAKQIEHDHTQLDVLFEDLHAVADAAFACVAEGADLELLDDARTNWSFLQEEIARHFGKEERKLFAVLVEEHPELKEPFARLAEQHQVLRRTISEIGSILKVAPEHLVERQDEFQSRWADLSALWSRHSETEWEILQGLAASNRLVFEGELVGGQDEHD